MTIGCRHKPAADLVFGRCLFPVGSNEIDDVDRFDMPRASPRRRRSRPPSRAGQFSGRFDLMEAKE
jgi:hypothetical protein